MCSAFFFPQLLTAEDGTVKLEFTMPEAVTAWRFMGFAHDKKLRSGYLEGAIESGERAAREVVEALRRDS